MESFLTAAARATEHTLDLFAIIVVIIGSLEAIVGIIRAVRGSDDVMRQLWLRYARWLVAALTFELGADIVSTTIAPSWEDLGRVAAIALIRTFLTYFLDRDVERAAGTVHA
jgi:uncharacterized membrane protein